MRYWWVNHKQTFRHEFEGGYIWSPKRKKDGTRNRFYDFLREVAPGDVVFSYAHAVIQGAGFAVSHCYTCPRPAEFGHIGELWDIVGWRVDVRFQPFGPPIRPKAHLRLLEPLLKREESAPLRLSGDGQQHIYLTSISTELAGVLLGLAGLDAVVFRQDALRDSTIERQLVGQQEWEDLEQRRIITAEELSVTTRTALVKARVGQGLFKERVFGHEKACRLTQVTNPTHLVGSHIKPWRESNNEERLQGANGLLLTPTADHLFDRGFITFDDNGEVLVAKVADRVSLKRMGLDPEAPPCPRPFNVDQRHFLAHHRREIFLGV
ncbi:MAG: HNH endonuclease [Limisphaerales bacterium]